MTAAVTKKACFSGVYPHLAVFNQSPGECGIGAVVPWAGKLWYLTYCPHQPGGSPDKLYSMDPEGEATIHPESIGGTPAGRLIHKESNQLILGPYVIGADRTVRAVPNDKLFGRLSAVCRHLTDPENKVYVLDMEGRLYELDVHTLAVTKLFEKPVPGWHGKGMYKAQGRIVVSNNGEWHGGGTSTAEFQVEDLPESPDRLGILAEWNGTEWAIVERKQHTEVTGPGELLGNVSDEDPLWTMGWDRRSCLLKVLDSGTWHKFRLPKANYTYDGDHGWHTEWPRIRRVAEGFRMMDLHGMFYRFPETFDATHTGGIRPLSSHHQMVVDWCEWQGQNALACNHASHFDNPLLGRCQSNLWFLEQGELESFGPKSGWGGPWIEDDVAEGETSEPFLMAGFARRILHINHKSDTAVEFVLEIDKGGNGTWQAYQTLTVKEGQNLVHSFPADLQAEWVRITPKRDVTSVTAYFHLGEDPKERVSLQPGKADAFAAIPAAEASTPIVGGIVRPMGKGYPQEETRLQFIARLAQDDGTVVEKQYIVDQDMAIRPNEDPELFSHFKEKLKGDVTELDFGMDEASIWIEEEGQRFRLPKGSAAFDTPFAVGLPRGKREIITERSVWNAHGSFYEIPRENSFGIRHMRPICTHNRTIMDYCTWRGLLTIAGIHTDAASDSHCVRSEDGQAGLWFGAVDDLWKLGKAVGKGGPLKDTPATAGQASDPYLMTGYDKRSLTLSHDADTTVTFRVEIDPTGYDNWVSYEEFTVAPGEQVNHAFATDFSAHWVRVVTDRDCKATAMFTYA